MRLALMQPYFFPYVGYFQLIKAVDKFVIYDVASYIKGGWINRNYLLARGEKQLFTVPLKNASSFSSIKDTLIDPHRYPLWKDKFFKTVAQNYQRAPYYATVTEMLVSVLDRTPHSIADLNASCLNLVCNYLGLKSNLITHSDAYGGQAYKGRDQIIHICRLEGAATYINPIGGVELYSKGFFSEHNIQLLFLQMGNFNYPQLGMKFVSGLSIIDLLMFNSIQDLFHLLDNYELI